MKIYTKTGDKGTTMLFGGGRVPKHHIRIEAYGTVDELNSVIGMVRDQLSKSSHKDILLEIQGRLFTVGAVLATNPTKKNAQPPDLLESDIELLENEMDKMNETLPPLTHFILPGGHLSSSTCHLARCVCRRSERNVTFLAENEEVPEIVIRYLNRLSDYLFVLARAISKENNAEEIKWHPRKK